MAALGMVLGCELRRRWRSWLALALLLGAAGAAVLTAAAGARRTDTAYRRFEVATGAGSLLVTPASGGLGDDLRGLPGVAAFAREVYLQMALLDRSGQPDPTVSVRAPEDVAFAASVDRPKVLQGRMPDPARTDEALIDQGLARRDHLGPGGRLHLLDIPNSPQGNPDLSRARPLAFRVTGVAVFDDGVVPVVKNDSWPQVLLTAAFERTRTGDGDAAIVRLRPGMSPAAFEQAAQPLAARHPEVGAGQLAFADLAAEARQVEAAIRPQAVALALFAALAALISLAVVGQLISRQVTLDVVEFPVLRGIGLGRRELAALSLLRVAAASLLGALVAGVAAIALSPIMPIGPARLAEPAPGVEVNLAILGLGCAAIALLPLLAALPAAWGAARAGASGARAGTHAVPSRLGGLTATVPATVTVGVRMALEPGRGRSAVPVRSALVATALAIGAVVSALVFGWNLSRLVATPQLYGQRWDLEVDLQFVAASASTLKGFLAGDPGIASYALGSYGVLAIDSQAVPAVGLDPGPESVYPTLVAGRAATGPGEIVLGASTLRQLHRRIGETVSVTVGGSARAMRIVGEAVFPTFGQGSLDPTGLGQGAAVAGSVLGADTTAGVVLGTGGPFYNFALVRLTHRGALPATEAAIGRQAAASGCVAAAGCNPLVTTQRPGQIGNYARVRQSPFLLAGCLALLALATLAHVLVTSIRRRRRDLVLLRALGFVPRQVSAALAWEATTLALVALAFGLPMGVAAGRFAWGRFADSLGAAGGAAVPFGVVAIGIPLTVAVANLIAAGPGWIASRYPPADALRVE